MTERHHYIVSLTRSLVIQRAAKSKQVTLSCCCLPLQRHARSDKHAAHVNSSVQSTQHVAERCDMACSGMAELLTYPYHCSW